MYQTFEGRAVTVTPVIDGNIYAAGDAMGGKLTLTGIVPKGASVGMIRSIVIVDQDNEKAPIDVVFFAADPSGTTFTNNGALDVADADALKVAGVVSILAADYVSFADNAVATKQCALAVAPADGRTLYAALVCRATPTYTAATDLQLTVVVA